MRACTLVCVRVYACVRVRVRAGVCRYTCACMSARVRWYHHHKSLPAPPTSVGTCLNKDDIRVRECGVRVVCLCGVRAWWEGGGSPRHMLYTK